MGHHLLGALLDSAALGPEELSGCLLLRTVQGLAPGPFMDFLTFCSGQPCLMVMDSHFTGGEVGVRMDA